MGVRNMLPDMFEVLLLSLVFTRCSAVSTPELLKITPRILENRYRFIWQRLIPAKLLGVICLIHSKFMMPIIDSVCHCYVGCSLSYIVVVVVVVSLASNGPGFPYVERS